MNDMKILAEKEMEMKLKKVKIKQKTNQTNKNIQLGYWNGIWLRKICDAYNEKLEKVLQTE